MALFSGITLWALVAAAIASFVFGGVWYGVLGSRWNAARYVPRPAGQSGPPPAVLAATVVAELVMAWMFAGLLLHLTHAAVPATARNGMISGFFLWLGFCLMPMIVNNLYQGAKRELTVIDGLHWLGVMLIQGAVLGAYAIR